MKNTIIILLLCLGLSFNSFAEPNYGGLFQRGTVSEEAYHADGMNRDGFPLLPNQHNMNGNQDANTPLGGGIVVMIGLGAAYALCNKKKEK